MSDEALKQIAKLPENRRCANCDADNRFGWNNIAIKFRVFVCGKCKSAFQAYSYRVKEIGQSNFTQAEVDGLRSRAGGGNDAARNTFLARLPLDSPLRPRDGDPDAKYKEFVIAVYEERRYFSAGGDISGGSMGASRPTDTPPPSPSPSSSVGRGRVAAGGGGLAGARVNGGVGSAGGSAGTTDSADADVHSQHAYSRPNDSPAPPPPAPAFGAMKGRWGPSSSPVSEASTLPPSPMPHRSTSSSGSNSASSPSSSSSSSNSRGAVNSGWGDNSSGSGWQADGADGIKIRTHPPSAAGSEGEVDLLGGMSAAAAAAAPTPTHSSASAGGGGSASSLLDDFLSGGGNSSGGGGGYSSGTPSASPHVAIAGILGSFGSGSGMAQAQQQQQAYAAAPAPQFQFMQTQQQQQQQAHFGAHHFSASSNSITSMSSSMGNMGGASPSSTGFAQPQQQQQQQFGMSDAGGVALSPSLYRQSSAFGLDAVLSASPVGATAGAAVPLPATSSVTQPLSHAPFGVGMTLNTPATVGLEGMMKNFNLGSAVGGAVSTGAAAQPARPIGQQQQQAAGAPKPAAMMMAPPQQQQQQQPWGGATGVPSAAAAGGGMNGFALTQQPFGIGFGGAAQQSRAGPMSAPSASAMGISSLLAPAPVAMTMGPTQQQQQAAAYAQQQRMMQQQQQQQMMMQRQRQAQQQQMMMPQQALPLAPTAAAMAAAAKSGGGSAMDPFFGI